jgi:hypothetical protein
MGHGSQEEPIRRRTAVPTVERSRIDLLSAFAGLTTEGGDGRWTQPAFLALNSFMQWTTSSIREDGEMKPTHWKFMPIAEGVGKYSLIGSVVGLAFDAFTRTEVKSITFEISSMAFLVIYSDQLHTLRAKLFLLGHLDPEIERNILNLTEHELRSRLISTTLLAIYRGSLEPAQWPR